MAIVTEQSTKKTWTTSETQELQRELKKALETPKSLQEKEKIKKAKPVPATKIIDLTTAGDGKGKKTRDECIRAGEAELKKETVAVVVLAGGQASRLKSTEPKGTFKFDKSDAAKCTFKLIKERLEKVNAKYNVTLPLLVMTSEATHADTEAFFAKTKYPKLHLFKQDMLPALCKADLGLVKTAKKGAETTGKDDAAEETFLAPNGNGNVFAALKRSALLEKLEKTVRFFHVITVDNVLARPADPAMVGAAVLHQTDALTKVAPKKTAKESCGLFADIDDKLTCIEYSEWQHMADGPCEEWKKTAGKWDQNANLAIHLFTTDFVKRAADAKLPLHVAEKKIAATPHSGIAAATDVYKLETFVFDAIPLVARKAMLAKVDRDSEFAPLKNLDGDDSPAACEKALKTTKPKDDVDKLFLL